MYRKTRFLLILCCLASFFQAKAQFDDPKTIEVGPHVGLSYYMGDLNPMIPFAQSQLQYGGVVRFNWDNRWTFRFDYAHATVKADDEVIKWRPERKLNFMTKLNDFSLEAEFNFLEYYTGNPKKNVSPYIFAGISVFMYTPYMAVADTMLNLRDYNTEDPYGEDVKWYKKMFSRTMPVGFSIPFGVGVKMSMSRHMAATVEWRMQKTFTDYLDDVATVYPERHETVVIEGVEYDLTDPSGTYKPGHQRGNSAFNDWFGMARVSLTWKFNLPDGRGCNLSKF